MSRQFRNDLLSALIDGASAALPIALPIIANGVAYAAVSELQRGKKRLKQSEYDDDEYIEALDDVEDLFLEGK